MATVVKSFAIQGIEGYNVDIETKILDGQPMISIIGMGDTAVKESADRIQSAIDESGYVFPKKRVIISLAPGDMKKKGSHYDLAMAIGVLQEDDNIASKELHQYAFIGELCLDRRVKDLLWDSSNDSCSEEIGNKKDYHSRSEYGRSKFGKGD